MKKRGVALLMAAVFAVANLSGIIGNSDFCWNNE